MEAVIRHDASKNTATPMSKSFFGMSFPPQTTGEEEIIGLTQPETQRELDEIKATLSTITSLLQSKDKPEVPIDTNLSTEEYIEQFGKFALTNLNQSELTVLNHRAKLKRFFREVQKHPAAVKEQDIRDFMVSHNGLGASARKNHLCTLRRFYRDFLKHPDVISSFELPRAAYKPKIVPTKTELLAFYNALESTQERALFLTVAASGLRRNEVLSLKNEQINLTSGMVVPNAHDGQSKNAWLSFLNSEALEAVKKYVAETNRQPKDRLFTFDRSKIDRVFDNASKRSGVKINPQTLRQWFAVELAKLGVSDRYVDAFCGRTPKSVLAKHYSDYSPSVLKEMYDKAGLKILN